MKTFKQHINEISFGPKAGKEWTSYIHAMFGDKPFTRSKKFEELFKEKINKRRQELEREKQRQEDEDNKWDYLSGPEDWTL